MHRVDHTDGFHAEVLKDYVGYSSYPETQILVSWDKKAMSAKKWYFYKKFLPDLLMKTLYDLAILPYLTSS
jgi:hypothetical protein